MATGPHVSITHILCQKHIFADSNTDLFTQNRQHGENKPLLAFGHIQISRPVHVEEGILLEHRMPERDVIRIACLEWSPEARCLNEMGM